MNTMLSQVHTVTVLLATFNGGDFLEEQLRSLSKQVGVKVEVLVNDDGSTDGTLRILDFWKEEGLITSITKSKTLGSSKAFLRLLQSCGTKTHVAFCDQDDVWEPNKLVSQIGLCEGTNPTLVFSSRSFIDSSGAFIGVSQPIKKSPSFENALIENVAPGNTVLLNSSAVKIINSFASPEITHYDSWIYLLISAYGKCKYISEPLLRYRIHENNQVGLREFNMNKLESSALNFIRQASYLSENSKPGMSDKHASTLSKFISVLQAKNKKKKLISILNARFQRQYLIHQICFRIIFLILVSKGKI